MIKQHKDILARIIRGLRQELVGSTATDGTRIRGNLDRELERLGITLDGRILPLDALPNATPLDQRAHYAAEVAIERMRSQGRSTIESRTEYVEQAAYSWINRLVALRALEARGLIDETLRPREDYGGLSEAMYLLRQSNPAIGASPDGGLWIIIEEACAKQATALPGLFSATDPVITLRPSITILKKCVELIGAGPIGIPTEETDAAFADPDAIGWAYQFYQEEAKQQAFAAFGSGKKADSRAMIAAATQLFTEPYMVRWLLQNSLGRTYHECYPASNLPHRWEYYIAPTPDRPLGPPAPTTPNLNSLTVLDPCMGSGHFLRTAFDMLAEMYREQEPEWNALRIADKVLCSHVYGIDIDPRAVQLAALTLYLRALELIRDEARRRRRPMPAWSPPTMNLATTPTGLDEGALDRHLARHPEDRPLSDLLTHIFDNLRQAELLGSLLRPSDEIDAAIAKMQRPSQHSLLDDVSSSPAFDLAGRDPDTLKRLVLDRIAAAFQAEATMTDAADALFGREAERGIRLLQLLDQRYAIVVTNPPYMGSRNLPELLKKFVERHYKSGKRDLYAAFILRCLELCRTSGRVAMVTQQSWMFLRSFADLRAIPEENLKKISKMHGFTGLLRETSIESLAHLGAGAFEEVSGEVVQSVMFAIANKIPCSNQQMIGIRLTSFKTIGEKVNILKTSDINRYRFNQADFIMIDRAPLTYWLSAHFVDLLRSSQQMKEATYIRQGICTTDNTRFIRFTWEAPSNQLQSRWFLFAKGGGVQRWSGFDMYVVDWQLNGIRVKGFQEETPGAIHWSGRMPSEDYLFKAGWTFTRVSGGTLAAREIPQGSLFGHTSPAAIPFDTRDLPVIGYWLNTRLATYLLRAMTQSLNCQEGYVQRLPLPNTISIERAQSLISVPLAARRWLSALNMVEWSFSPTVFQSPDRIYFIQQVELYYLVVEGLREQLAVHATELSIKEVTALCDELGTPVGWLPLIVNYDTLTAIPADLALPPLPQEVLDHLASKERITPSTGELARIKNNLRALYEAGPGAKDVTQDESEPGDDEDEDNVGGGAYIPIPPETFLEELSVKLQIHPISVYRMLEELRTQGVRCKPEERRLLEDRLSVLVLQLLGHRWPRQLEAGEPVPQWADHDGIIPLTTGNDTTLTKRVRERLRAEEGDIGAQRIEALLVELTGAVSLEDWLRRFFWTRHVKQFKSRPIAWHLASRPAKGKGKSARPLFECLLYYHASGSNALARLRTQYVEPLLRAEEAALTQARINDNVTAIAAISVRVQELQDFATRLLEVERDGFACADLDNVLATETLDRWSGDGITAPSSRDDLVRAERFWLVDLNDGVRVNIAPLQLGGLLASDVLKVADARKAIADRARWRADERHWVREGKLQRCGWMSEQVPESPEWTRRAPERLAEQQKLEQKRRAALERLEGDLA